MKMSNTEARLTTDRDYYGEGIEKVQGLKDMERWDTSWDYYSGGNRKIRLRDARTGEVVGEVWD